MVSLSSRVNKHSSLDWQDIQDRHQKTTQNPFLKDFYKALLVDGNLPLAQVPFVAMDFETTGLDPQADDIVSIGVVPFDLNRVYCHQAIHWLVNPRQPLEEESVIIHGITHADIKRAPDLQHVLAEILSALMGKIIVVHYHQIEREFLDRAVMIRWGEDILFPVIDTMLIEAALHRKRKFWPLLKTRKQVSIRLATSRERYGLPAYQCHHALCDAIATAELFQAQVAHHFTGSTPLADLWV